MAHVAPPLELPTVEGEGAAVGVGFWGTTHTPLVRVDPASHSVHLPVNAPLICSEHAAHLEPATAAQQ